MKNVLLTGGTRGLGLATAERLAHDGFHVVATGRSRSTELEKLESQEFASEGRVTFAQLDLCSSDGLQEFIRSVTQRFGPLFGLVNNAALGHDGVLATMHQTQIEEMIRVNLTSAILLTKYACRSMLTRREGRIVNVSSIIAGTGFNGLSVYAATKAALIGFSKSLAREVGKAGVTVNTVSPGYMQTGMTADIDEDKLETIRRRSPLGRLAEVSEVAAAVAFLLGPDAKSLTGSDIKVDAGSTA